MLGQVELDELLAEREKINHELQTILDKQTDPWGIKVSSVEVKHVDLPAEMQRAMAKQAEAEREKRAKIIQQAASGTQVEVLFAALAIHAHPELNDQLQQLLERAVAWHNGKGQAKQATDRVNACRRHGRDESV